MMRAKATAKEGVQACSSGLATCAHKSLDAISDNPSSGPPRHAPPHPAPSTVAQAVESHARDCGGPGCRAADGQSDAERFVSIRATRTALLKTLAMLQRRHGIVIARTAAAVAAATTAASDDLTERRRGRSATAAASRKGGGRGGVGIGCCPSAGTSTVSTVVFKDENSSVIAEVPAAVATRLDADITHVVTNLVTDPAFATDRHANLAKASTLQDRMRKGLQQVSDFSDVGALFGCKDLDVAVHPEPASLTPSQ